MGVTGISFWSYHITDWDDPGLWHNQAKLEEYKELTREIRSLNDVLVLPTVSKSWLGRWDDSTVKLSDTSRSVNNPWGGSYSTCKLNYILKSDGTQTYLIIVNKDINPVNNVRVEIPSLSGVTRQISIIGNETTGSARPRTLQMTNGVFTDSFDGQTVHIYRLIASANTVVKEVISAPTPTPSLPACIINNFQDPGEAGIDCGGVCPNPCPPPACITSCPGGCANYGQPDTGLGCTAPCPDNSNRPCATANKCQLGQTCQGNKTCGEGFAKPCPPSSSCVSYSCSPSTGNCNPSFTNSVCSDNNICTDFDLCSNGICTGTTKDCNDGKDNTFDFCSDAGGVAACQSTDTTGGLIPRGRLIDDLSTGDINESQPCTLCAFFYMLKNIVNFIMELAIGIGVFVLVIAGLMYSFSIGDPGKIVLAKTAISKTIGGIIIIFIAWVAVAIILQALGYANAGVWNQVSCGV